MARLESSASLASKRSLMDCQRSLHESKMSRLAGDVQLFYLVVVHQDIQHPIAITIAGDEVILQLLHINLIDGPHKCQSTKPTEGDLETRVGLRLDA